MKLLTVDRPADPMSQDLYRVLGADRHDDSSALLLKFRRLSRLYHPDTSLQPNAAEKFGRVKKAFEVLSNSERRAMYDEFGRVPPSDHELSKEADSLLVKVLDGMLEEVEGQDEGHFDRVDLVASINGSIEQNMREIERRLRVEKAMVRKLEKMIDRLSRVSGDNTIALIAGHKIHKSKTAQFALSVNLMIWGRLKMTMGSYRYKLPEQPTAREPVLDVFMAFEELIRATRPEVWGLRGAGGIKGGKQ